jgi:hypothetical protein
MHIFTLGLSAKLLAQTRGRSCFRRGRTEREAERVVVEKDGRCDRLLERGDGGGGDFPS